MLSTLYPVHQLHRPAQHLILLLRRIAELRRADDRTNHYLAAISVGRRHDRLHRLLAVCSRRRGNNDSAARDGLRRLAVVFAPDRDPAQHRYIVHNKRVPARHGGLQQVPTATCDDDCIADDAGFAGWHPDPFLHRVAGPETSWVYGEYSAHHRARFALLGRKGLRRQRLRKCANISDYPRRQHPPNCRLQLQLHLQLQP